MITGTFRACDFKTRKVFLGPLKSSKIMLRKSILIGLFVLNNNRTIGEPKVFREGRKGNCPRMTFYGRLRLHRKLGVGFCTVGYGWHRSQWVKLYLDSSDILKYDRVGSEAFPLR